MIPILIVLTTAALVVLGLERNHRARSRLGSRLAGSNDVEDRDVPRVRCALRAEQGRATGPQVGGTRPERRGAPALKGRPAQPTGC